jgi:CBS domain-containing protein
MTRGALAVTEPGAACDAAIAVAARHRVRRLLVVDELRLVGVVSLRDLRAGGVVAERMRREVFAILADASLDEAAAAMAVLDVGMLPVIGERFVLGVITRGDLERIGAPARSLAPAGRTLTEAAHIMGADGDVASPNAVADDDSGLIDLADDTIA